MRCAGWWTVVGLVVSLVAAPQALARSGSAGDPLELLARIDAATLDMASAVTVAGLVLEAGPLTVHVVEGVLVPSSISTAGRTEAVFLGEAMVEFTPPDEIEAGQLELFTGRERLIEPVTEAVLVVCHDPAAASLLTARQPARPDEATVQRAGELFADWRQGTERRILGVRTALLSDSLGDPAFDAYFAGRFHGERLGTFLALIDPDEAEQVSLGQFVREEVTGRQRKQIERAIRRQQRRGRLVGLELDDLGDFDLWVSSSLRSASGGPDPGGPAFRGTHYEMEVSFSRSGERLGGTARITAQVVTAGRRNVRLDMNPDLRIVRVAGGDGAELPVVQDHGTAYAVLPRPPEGDDVLLTVEFEGPMLEKIQGTLFVLRDTQRWYPHVDDGARATYDVTFHWDERYDVVAAGSRVDGGSDRDGLWERRRVDVPLGFYTFELGRFDFYEETAGDVRLRAAFDRRTDAGENVRRQVIETVADTLEYYQEVFGPYPLDELTLVTTPRGYAQGLLGFVSLPSLLTIDTSFLANRLGLADRRAVIAHELAHQWWGNLLGWKSYRDQWLSEAMANYAAVSWAEARLPALERPRRSLVDGWQTWLLATTGGGRRIESLGPLVLGHRLDSSKADAMQPIVYKKGAVVLGMLENIFGQEAFLELQRTLLGVANYRDIDTATYLDALTRLSGIELDWFADRYIYGTGLPEFIYSYTISPAGDDTWTVAVEARLRRPVRFRCRVQRLADGSFDVRRTPEPVRTAADPAIAVPFHIGVIRDREKTESKKAAKTLPSVGGLTYDAVMDGRAFLEGEVSRFEVTTEHEPVALWLDRDARVFGRFFNEIRHPERVLLFEADGALLAGETDRAAGLLRQALEASGESPDTEHPFLQGDVLSLQARVTLGHLALDGGRLGEAVEALRVAREEARWMPAAARARLRSLEARIDLATGEEKRAFKTLRDALLKSAQPTDREGVALLAIAAHRVGDREALDETVALARKIGVVVEALVPAGP